MMDNKLINEILKAARGAGRIILNASVDSSLVSRKGGRANYVTAYDEAVQEFLIGRFTELLPEAHFVGEEEGQDTFVPEYETGYTFVIDPIDGTTNFMKDYGASVVSIALFKDGKPDIGVICNPYTNQMFWGKRGKGAYENGKRIRTSDAPLSESLVNMGTAPYYEELAWTAFQIGNWYMGRALDIRRTGSAAYDLCLVASGRIGLYFEPRLSLWDYAAGALIVREAGGKVTDLCGDELKFRGRSSVCAVSRGVCREDYLPPVELRM